MGSSYNYQATIVKIVDGDTVKLDIDLGFKIHIAVTDAVPHSLAWNQPKKISLTIMPIIGTEMVTTYWNAIGYTMRIA